MPVDPLDEPHLKLLLPWITRANREITDRVESARAHAERALTRSAIDANEGRQTWRLIAKQRSAKASQKRLDDLKAWLVGARSTSLDGHIQDARAKFYSEAFRHWVEKMPADIVDQNARPTVGGERNARGLILFGMSPRQEIEPAFLTAKSSLVRAINAAASPSISDQISTSIFDGWERKTIEAISRKVKGMLSDSQIYVINLVGNEMIKREFKVER